MVWITHEWGLMCSQPDPVCLSHTNLETGWWLPGNQWSLGKNEHCLTDNEWLLTVMWAKTPISGSLVTIHCCTKNLIAVVLVTSSLPQSPVVCMEGTFLQPISSSDNQQPHANRSWNTQWHHAETFWLFRAEILAQRSYFYTHQPKNVSLFKMKPKL